MGPSGNKIKVQLRELHLWSKLMPDMLLGVQAGKVYRAARNYGARDWDYILVSLKLETGGPT